MKVRIGILAVMLLAVFAVSGFSAEGEIARLAQRLQALKKGVGV